MWAGLSVRQYNLLTVSQDLQGKSYRVCAKWGMRR